MSSLDLANAKLRIAEDTNRSGLSDLFSDAASLPNSDRAAGRLTAAADQLEDVDAGFLVRYPNLSKILFSAGGAGLGGLAGIGLAEALDMGSLGSVPLGAGGAIAGTVGGSLLQTLLQRGSMESTRRQLMDSDAELSGGPGKTRWWEALTSGHHDMGRADAARSSAEPKHPQLGTTTKFPPWRLAVFRSLVSPPSLTANAHQTALKV